MFKNLIGFLKESGRQVYIHARNKDITVHLLESTGWEFQVSPAKFQGRLLQYFSHLQSYCSFIKDKDISFHIGSSVAIGPASRIYGGKSYCFSEDDAKARRLFQWLGYFPSHYAIKPGVLSFEAGKRDIYHPSLHELAYLHPDQFSSDPEILKKYDLIPRKYIIIRLSAFQAYHDKHAEGISRNFLENLNGQLSEYRLIISNEDDDNPEIKITDMHQVLAAAKLLISDSGTMTEEAAILGVPAIFCSSFSGQLSILNELAEKYELIYCFKPDEKPEISSRINQLLAKTGLNEEFLGRRDQLLQDKTNLFAWLKDFFIKQETDLGPEN